MTREIKFRVWNKKTKRMVNPHLTTPLALNKDCADLDGVFLPFHTDLELMQFTGLKDKNGVEIYEGDRVRFFLSNGDSHEGHVVFIDGCVEIYFKIALKIEGIFRLRDYLKCYTANHAVEIIGNIYENPQLLQE